MKVFFGIFIICFLVLMLALNAILSNAWLLIAAIAAVIAAFITVLYYQQERLEALEKRLEQLEGKE